MDKVIIPDSSPLISLYQVNQLSLLKKLYGTVFIPKGVYDEVVKKEYKDQAAKIRAASYIQIKTIKEEDEENVNFLMNENSPKLHRGESEVIVLAKEIKADLLIIDENDGRKVANLRYGFPVIGAVGIVLRSFDNEFLDEDDVRQVIDIWKKLDKTNKGELLETTFNTKLAIQKTKGYEP